MSSEYVPDVGHIVWIDFDRQAGREQRGRRPALVLSPVAYNAKTSLAVLCPITSSVKAYPFEVLIEGVPHISGAVLSDHAKSLDWRVRNAQFEAAIPTKLLEAVRLKLGALIGL